MSRIRKIVSVVPTSRASVRALLQGVFNYSRQHGSWSIYSEPEHFEKVRPMLLSGDVDGIVLQNASHLAEVLSLGIPAIVLEGKPQNFGSVVNVLADDVAIGRVAAEHMLACGFRNFAFCGAETSPVRGEGFAEAVSRAGFNCFTCPATGHAWKTPCDERQETAHWLRSLPAPTGVLACDDTIGVEVMEACRMAGLRVPDMFGVLGVDNDELLCELGDPPMSSVVLNWYRAGFDAAQSLDLAMSGGKVGPTRIIASPIYVMARRSTDYAAAAHPNFRKALQFIRDHAAKGLSVDEVATAAGLSRRSLEKWFRKFSGRSVLEEIRRVRTDQIARLLVETDLPVVQIADRLGFADTQHIARYFRAGKQTNPMNYRKIHGYYRGSQNGDSFPRTGVVPPRPHPLRFAA